MALSDWLGGIGGYMAKPWCAACRKTRDQIVIVAKTCDQIEKGTNWNASICNYWTQLQLLLSTMFCLSRSQESRDSWAQSKWQSDGKCMVECRGGCGYLVRAESADSEYWLCQNQRNARIIASCFIWQSHNLLQTQVRGVGPQRRDSVSRTHHISIPSLWKTCTMEN